MSHSGNNVYMKSGSSLLETDGYCDSGLGMDSGCLSIQSIAVSGNLPSVAQDQTDQLSTTFSHLQVSPQQQQQQQHNSHHQTQYLSLVQAAPITTPESSEFFKQNEDGDTMLHITIIQCNSEAALYCIRSADEPSTLNIQNYHYNHTPLHLAVITNQPLIVRELVVRGASLWKQDRDGNMAAHLACKHGFMECLRELTAPLSDQQRCTLVQRSIGYHTAPDLVQTIGLPLDYSVKNYEGETCLHVALNSNSPNRINIIMFLILSLAVDVNVQEGKCGYTILHQAIKTQEFDIIKFLLCQPGIDVNRACYNSSTPLSLARSLSQDEVVRQLLDRGAVECGSEDRELSSDSEDDQIDGFDDLMI